MENPQVPEQPGSPSIIVGPAVKNPNLRMPSRLTSVLNEWHRQRPLGMPPCAAEESCLPSRESRVFDSNQKELNTSDFKVTTGELTYYITVLGRNGQFYRVLLQPFR